MPSLAVLKLCTLKCIHTALLPHIPHTPQTYHAHTLTITGILRVGIGAVRQKELQVCQQCNVACKSCVPNHAGQAHSM